jgi:small-conductance mechanosensitive channel
MAVNFFSRVRLTISLALLALLVLCLAFAWSTRDAMAHLPFLKKERNQNTLVDLRPWQTAQALAPLAVSAEEAESAREAERLADHEVDQAFASALRQANGKQRSLTGEALRLSQKLAQLRQFVKEDQARVQSLTAAGKIPADDLAVAKAQLGLDSDEVADAEQDLAREAGDERGKIQQELATHEAAMKEYDAQAGKARQVAVLSAQRYDSLAALVKGWLDQRSRYQLIQQAGQQAQADAKALTAVHNQLEGEANAAATASGRLAAAEPDNTVELASLKNRAAQRQLLAIYDDRIQTQRQLATVYGKWSAQVLLQHRIVLHLMLQSFALIAFTLLCIVVFDALAHHFLERPTLDRRRMHALRTIFKIGIQGSGALLVALIVFGVPRQMPAIIGLATAGLTLVLQDFILAFFGWFVLMGKNGIRIGDWVEINGTCGEVVETGIFRTTLLETGNWTDKGHPTGRRVALINSFAIKGQYFNFSTTGQWMWDEIVLSIPNSEDTYRVIELVHKAVLQETESEARQAELEWKRVARHNGLANLTTTPTVNMRPGAGGIDIVVRYVTRAADRFDVRNRLYQRFIELLNKPLVGRAQLGATAEQAEPQTPPVG